MKTYKINEELEVSCEWKKTRIAFKHTAILLKNGREIDNTKICYQNRTWECFEFESVIKQLIGKTDLLTDSEKADFLKKISGQAKEETDAQFGTIAGIAKLGEIFGKNQKEKNDWKARMLKAGLGNRGLIMPDDWDDLNEDEKEKRLNGAIGQLV